MSDLAGRAARGAAVTLSTQLARAVLQFASLVVLARLLPPEAFGLVAMVTSVLGVAELLRDFGLSSAAIQAKSLSNAERSNLFWVNVAIGLACAAVAAGSAPLLVWLYSDSRVGPVVLALSGLLVVSGVTTQFRAELSRALRFKALAAVDLSAQLAGISAAIVAAVLGAGYWAIVAQQVAFVVTTCLLSVVFSRWRPGAPRRDVSIRRFLGFGGSVLGTQVLGYTTNNVDNIALGAVWGAGPLGFYTRAYQLLMVPINQLNDPMSRVVLPILSRVHGDPARYQRYVERAQQVGTHALAPLFAIAAGLSGPLVAVLFGPGWSAVGPIFFVLALGGVFRGVGLVTYWIFLSSGEAAAQLKLYLVARPVMIGVILAGLPFGALGVAIGHSVAFSLYWAVSLRHAATRAHLQGGRLFGQVVRSLVLLSAPAGLVAAALSRLVEGPVLQLLLGGAGGVAYLVLVLLLVPGERRQVLAVVTLLRRGRRAPGSPLASEGLG